MNCSQDPNKLNALRNHLRDQQTYISFLAYFGEDKIDKLFNGEILDTNRVDKIVSDLPMLTSLLNNRKNVWKTANGEVISGKTKEDTINHARGFIINKLKGLDFDDETQTIKNEENLVSMIKETLKAEYESLIEYLSTEDPEGTELQVRNLTLLTDDLILDNIAKTTINGFKEMSITLSDFYDSITENEEEEDKANISFGVKSETVDHSKSISLKLKQVMLGVRRSNFDQDTKEFYTENSNTTGLPLYVDPNELLNELSNLALTFFEGMDTGVEGNQVNFKERVLQELDKLSKYPRRGHLHILKRRIEKEIGIDKQTQAELFKYIEKNLYKTKKGYIKTNKDRRLIDGNADTESKKFRREWRNTLSSIPDKTSTKEIELKKKDEKIIVNLIDKNFIDDKLALFKTQANNKEFKALANTLYSIGFNVESSFLSYLNSEYPNTWNTFIKQFPILFEKARILDNKYVLSSDYDIGDKTKTDIIEPSPFINKSGYDMLNTLDKIKIEYFGSRDNPVHTGVNGQKIQSKGLHNFISKLNLELSSPATKVSQFFSSVGRSLLPKKFYDLLTNHKDIYFYEGTFSNYTATESSKFNKGNLVDMLLFLLNNGSNNFYVTSPALSDSAKIPLKMVSRKDRDIFNNNYKKLITEDNNNIVNYYNIQLDLLLEFVIKEFSYNYAREKDGKKRFLSSLLYLNKEVYSEFPVDQEDTEGKLLVPVYNFLSNSTIELQPLKNKYVTQKDLESFMELGIGLLKPDKLAAFNTMKNDVSVANIFTPTELRIIRSLIYHNLAKDRDAVMDVLLQGNFITLTGNTFNNKKLSSSLLNNYSNFSGISIENLELVKLIAHDLAFTSSFGNKLFGHTFLGGLDQVSKNPKSILTASEFINYANNVYRDYVKRNKKAISPGYGGIDNYYNPITKQFETSRTFNQVVIDDVSIVGKLGVKMDIADAQEYQTIQEALDVKWKNGKISEELYKKASDFFLNPPDTITEEYKELLEKLNLIPDKMVYTGIDFDNNNPNSFMDHIYIKTSTLVLVPAYTKGTELDKLRVAMEKTGVRRVAMKSGTKLWNGKVADPFIDKKQSDKMKSIEELVVLFNDSKKVLDRKYLRTQLEFPEAHTNNVKLLSQPNSLLFSEDLLNTDGFIYKGKTYNGRSLNAIKENIVKEMVSLSFNDIIKKLGNGELSTKMFSKLIKKEALARNWPQKEIDLLEYDENTNDFKVPLLLNPAYLKIESLVLSMINSSVILKMTGQAFIQASSLGVVADSDIVLQNSGIVFTSEKSKSIKNNKKFELEYNKEEGVLEVLLPYFFKGIKLEELLDSEGNLDFQKVDPNLLDIIGFRIPYQKFSSMGKLRVVGFLPAHMKDTIVVPGEITAQMGSDFDVDKVISYLYNYEVKDGKISIYRNKENNLKTLRNDYLDIIKSVVNHPSVIEKITTPLDNDDLANEKIFQLSLKTDPNNVNDLYGIANNIDAYDQIVAGLTAVGIAANFNTFEALANKNNIKLITPLTTTIETEEGTVQLNLDTFGIFSKSYYKNNKGEIIVRTKSDNLSAFIDGAVDNAKKVELGPNGLNDSNFGVYGVMLTLSDENLKISLSPQHIIRFLNHPAIVKYELGKFSQLPSFTPSNTIFIPSIEELTNDLVSKKPPEELPNSQAILNSYLILKSIADQVRKLQAATDIKSKGVGKSLLLWNSKQAFTTYNENRYPDLEENSTQTFLSDPDGEVSFKRDKANDLLSMFGSNLLSNNKFTNSIINKLTKLKGYDLTPDDYKEVVDSLRSFILNAGNYKTILNDTVKLTVGENSLAKRINKIKLQDNKSNYSSQFIKLLDHLEISINSGSRVPIDRIKLKTNLISKDIIDELSDYILNIVIDTSVTLEEKEIVDDLINYSIATGFNLKLDSIANIIDINLLNAKIANKVQLYNELMLLNDDELNSVVEDFIIQFVQNNPSSFAKTMYGVQTPDAFYNKKLSGLTEAEVKKLSPFYQKFNSLAKEGVFDFYLINDRLFLLKDYSKGIYITEIPKLGIGNDAQLFYSPNTKFFIKLPVITNAKFSAFEKNIPDSVSIRETSETKFGQSITPQPQLNPPKPASILLEEIEEKLGEGRELNELKKLYDQIKDVVNLRNIEVEINPLLENKAKGKVDIANNKITLADENDHAVLAHEFYHILLRAKLNYMEQNRIIDKKNLQKTINSLKEKVLKENPAINEKIDYIYSSLDEFIVQHVLENMHTSLSLPPNYNIEVKEQILDVVLQDLVEKNIQINSIDELVLYSGGAKGSDIAWDNIGSQFGLKNKIHYIPQDLAKLTEENLEEIEEAYQRSVIDLGRKILKRGTYTGDLVRRDYLQVKSADAIFAISYIISPGHKDPKGFTNNTKKEIVSGGTGYAVQMAIYQNKPIFVFDQNRNQWFKWNYNTNNFIKTTIPVLTKKFAGIGTRELQKNGEQAIESVYIATKKAIEANKSFPIIKTPQPAITPTQELEIKIPNDYKHVLPEGEQKDAIIEAVNHFKNSKPIVLSVADDLFSSKTKVKVFLIDGKAGTGKTTIVPFIIETLGIDRSEVIVSAVSHQAKTNLGSKMPGVKEASFASLLGKKPDKGVFKLVPGESLFGEAKLVVIDEASMLGQADLNDLFTSVVNDAEGKETMILFLGDIGQIRPIESGNENKTTTTRSPLFNDSGKITTVLRDINDEIKSYKKIEKQQEIPIKSSRLTKIRRQSDESPILDVAAKYWFDNLEESDKTSLPIPHSEKESNIKNKGAVLYVPTINSIVPKIASLFIDAMRNREFFSTRIVTYNRQDKLISEDNNYIKDIHTLVLKAFSDKPQIDDLFESMLLISSENVRKIIKRKPELILVNSQPFYLNNSPEKISSAKLIEKVNFNLASDRTVRLFLETKFKELFESGIRFYNVEIKDEKDLTYDVVLLHPYDTPQFNTFIKKWSSSFNEKRPTSTQWAQFYNVKDSFNIVQAELPYTGTAHKVQGSTYKVSIVDVNNINTVRLNSEKNEIIYTGITRASHLTIIADKLAKPQTIKVDEIDLLDLKNKLVNNKGQDIQIIPNSYSIIDNLMTKLNSEGYIYSNVDNLEGEVNEGIDNFYNNIINNNLRGLKYAEGNPYIGKKVMFIIRNKNSDRLLVVGDPIEKREDGVTHIINESILQQQLTNESNLQTDLKKLSVQDLKYIINSLNKDQKDNYKQNIQRVKPKCN